MGVKGILCGNQGIFMYTLYICYYEDVPITKMCINARKKIQKVKIIEILEIRDKYPGWTNSKNWEILKIRSPQKIVYVLLTEWHKPLVLGALNVENKSTRNENLKILLILHTCFLVIAKSFLWYGNITRNRGVFRIQETYKMELFARIIIGF